MRNSPVRNWCSLALMMFASVPAFAQNEKTPPASQPASAELPKVVYVDMRTSKGDIVLELNHDKAPISVENFLAYVDKGFYDGTIFHRVIPNFMIQGGGFTPEMQEKPTNPPIKNEWRNNLKNKTGTIAMARTNVADSATSQFFINVADNAFLDQPRDGAAYAVFGKVVAGMDTVDKIKNVPTGSKEVAEPRAPQGHMTYQNVPVEPVMIIKVTRITPEEAQKKIEPEKKPADNSGPATPHS